MQQDRSSLLYSWLVLGQLSSVSAHYWVDCCTQANLSVSQLCQLILTNEAQFGLSDKDLSKLNSAATTADRTLESLARNPNIQVISFTDSHYPVQLKNLTHPPAVLFVLGDKETLNSLQVAIVGSRYATINGRKITEEMASAIASHGIVVTSGLAKGIDSSAHIGALTTGKTLAVLGCGVDVCYPSSNKALYNRILDNGGALITEFMPGTPPRGYHFPRRNRIVAALSAGVLVVEAKIRSGSLITANLAADLGRDVFAVPGNISHPLSEGVNWLIQQGAKLVTSYADILEEYAAINSTCSRGDSVKKPLATDPILDSVDYDVTSLIDITTRSKLSSREVLTALLEYELRGLVAAVPGGYLKLRGK